MGVLRRSRHCRKQGRIREASEIFPKGHLIRNCFALWMCTVVKRALIVRFRGNDVANVPLFVLMVCILTRLKYYPSHYD